MRLSGASAAPSVSQFSAEQVAGLAIEPETSNIVKM
jgi:hypothetical protein